MRWKAFEALSLLHVEKRKETGRFMEVHVYHKKYFHMSSLILHKNFLFLSHLDILIWNICNSGKYSVGRLTFSSCKQMRKLFVSLRFETLLVGKKVYILICSEVRHFPNVFKFQAVPFILTLMLFMFVARYISFKVSNFQLSSWILSS